MKRILMSLMAMFCLMTVSAQGKYPNGHVFNVMMSDTDMIEEEGKIAIKQVGDASKTQPYILIKAVSPNMKKRMINNQKLMMVFTNGAGIP